MIVKELHDVSQLKKDRTKHIDERIERAKKYKALLSETFIHCFRVDNYHPNGDEIHCINDKGLIYIYNYNSHKLITILHPRPQQFKRYYQQLNMKIPREIKKMIDKNYKRNVNSKFNEL